MDSKIKISKKLNPISASAIRDMRDGINALQSALDLMRKGIEVAVKENNCKISFYDTSMAWLTHRISHVEYAYDSGTYVCINGLGVYKLKDLSADKVYAITHSIATDGESTKDY